ncbi:MAG: hypothetical protein RMI56_01775 [Sulfolobales archaeon]|nr:hypothetical protein [Sulfolobales archaeon]MDW8082506.1 hypothetical protein [Sulfolobales archaeon]
MELVIVYDERHRLHRDLGGKHPEGVWRVEESMTELHRSRAWDYVRVVRALDPDYSAVLLAHDADYVEWIRRECSKGFHYIDADTYVTEHTCDVAASFAASTREAAIKSAETGSPWLIMARPGGHHAGRRGPAMGAPTLGFCVFDYTAIAAITLADVGRRVLVLDFDAHHGNGTQEILWSDPRVLHIDIHQRWIYPGTGYIEDIGGRGAEGTKVNVPLYPDSGDENYSWVLVNVVEKAREIFKPDVAVVFAGFDAHREDRLTQLQVTEAVYSLIGHYLRKLLETGEISGLVSILGGGYGRGMVRSFRSYVEGLLNIASEPEIHQVSPGRDIEYGMSRVLDILSRTTRSLRKLD